MITCVEGGVNDNDISTHVRGICDDVIRTLGGSARACLPPPATRLLTVRKKSSARSSFGLRSACKGIAMLCKDSSRKSTQGLGRVGICER